MTTPIKMLSPGPLPQSRVVSNGPLPKIQRNDVLKAVNQTFVQPAVNKVTSGFRAMNPLNMARQWAFANPITSKLIDFKSNLDDNRTERDRPNREARAIRGSADDNGGWRGARQGMWDPINRAGGEGGVGGDSSAVVAAVDQLRESNASSFMGLMGELRAIRSNTITMVRNTNLSFNEQKKTTGSIVGVAEAIRELNIAKGPTQEDRIEANKGTATAAEVGNKPEGMLRSLIGLLLGSALGFVGRIASGIAAAALAFKVGLATFNSGIAKMFGTVRLGILVVGQELRVAMSGLAARIVNVFKQIQLPRSLVSLGTRIGAFFGSIDAFAKSLRVPTGVIKVGETISKGLSGLGRIIAPVAKLGPMIMGAVSKVVATFASLGKFLLPLGQLGGAVARLGGFLKFIPVVGQFILVATAIFDGIKGFISGWTGTEGSFMQKAWGGLKGAVTGIVKGFIAPFKWLGEILWKGIKSIGEALGLGKFIKQLESIDFGEIFKKVLGVFNPGNVVGKVFDWFFDFIKGLADKVLGAAAAPVKALIEGAKDAGGALQETAASLPGALGAAGQWAGQTWDRLTDNGGSNSGGTSTPQTDNEGKPIAFSRAVPIEGRALLDAIAGTESPGYNIRYDGTRDGATFDPSKGHPNVAARITTGPNKGDTSSAAGRYQFLTGTWRENAEDPNDFSPEAQDRAAWKLAQDTYRSRTGRSLELDLKEPARQGEIGRILRDKWTSLPGGIEQANGNTVNRFQQRFNEALGQQQAAERNRASAGTTASTNSAPAITRAELQGRPKIVSDEFVSAAARRLNNPVAPSWASNQVGQQAQSLNDIDRARNANAYARRMAFQQPSSTTNIVAPTTNNVTRNNFSSGGGQYRYNRSGLDSGVSRW